MNLQRPRTLLEAQVGRLQGPYWDQVFCVQCFHCGQRLSTIFFPRSHLTPISERQLHRGTLLAKTRDHYASPARIRVSGALFNRLRVKEQYCLVGDQEPELHISSFYPSHVTTEHHCTLSHKKRKEKSGHRDGLEKLREVI